MLLKDSQARTVASEESIAFFAQYYLHNHIKSSLGNLHREWIKWMREPRIAIAAPRSHAKSTWFSLVYPLWCLLFQRKKFIVLISDTSTQAEELLGTIIEELETNEFIIEDFGRIAGYIPEKMEEKSKWTAKDIVTTTGVKIIARGWKSKLRGIKMGSDRPDLIIVDDVENDENVQSEEQRRKVEGVFRKSILNLGSQDTQIIVVGTILHFDSLLNNLIQTPIDNWKTRLYRALENGKPIWPKWWSVETLDTKRKEIGNIAFEQEFNNNPLDPSTQIIKPIAFYEDPIDLTLYDMYAYIDLAISEKETADYTAIVTVGRHRQTGEILVIEPVRIRGNITQQLELVFTMADKYHYVSFGVESVAYQKAFYQLLVQESAKRNRYIPAVEIELDKDKVRRVIEITPYIESGVIKFNNNYQDFMAELIQFPKGSHDDFVDAFVGAAKLALDGGGSAKIVTGSSIKYPKNI